MFDTVTGVDPIFVGAGDIADCTVTGDIGDRGAREGHPRPRSSRWATTSTTTACCRSSTPATPRRWGVPEIKDRTWPITGNHDFGNGSNNGGGYFDYFNGVGVDDGPGGPRNTGIYSYDLNQYWHVVALNSECGNAGVGCAAGSPQETWLREDLAASAGKNVIVLIHRPYISSGVSNGLATLAPLFKAAHDYGVDLFLSGHDHHYEVFQPLNATGSAVDATSGVRVMIIGNGRRRALKHELDEDRQQRSGTTSRTA